MQTTILFKVAGRPSTSPVVILTGPCIRAKSTNRSASAKKAFRALFSSKATLAAAILCACAVWWDALTIADTIDAQAAIAIDCLLAMPWGIIGVLRAIRKPMPEKGGEK